ncbi:UMP-CMP kinase 1 [Madurella mycetomatis]|uniref:UMP-CMP kinase 1 n=1 Tax=Madurella mycetomatis TaxID=100816 RepID=A0A175W408_9PEZI|nr:UMP-CMP kinase 1 [Madurella mycetomatis]
MDTASVSQPADYIIAVLGEHSLTNYKYVPPANLPAKGAPASGKGTLCKKVVHDPHFIHSLLHVSVGDLLRGMPSGPDINGHIAAGTVLPGDELVPILAAHISRLSPSAEAVEGRKRIVLLDGFPRSLEQEKAARKALASSSSEEFPDLAVYFSCPKEVLRDRYIARKRGMDDGLLFEKRYEQHEKECPAVVESYKKRGILAEIDSSRSIDESYKDFVGVLKSFLGQ